MITVDDLQDNSFEAGCYDSNSIQELIEALYQKAADKTDCQTWGITPAEWMRGIKRALEAKISSLG
jgi:hypothetical protein